MGAQANDKVAKVDLPGILIADPTTREANPYPIQLLRRFAGITLLEQDTSSEHLWNGYKLIHTL